MEKLIDYLFRFDRRLVCPIYDVEKDFGFACMDKVSIAADLGFTTCQAGIVDGVKAHPFRTEEEVEAFPWKIDLHGRYASTELEQVRSWIKQSSVPMGGGSFGPLTVAACILGVDQCSRMVHKQPSVLHAVLRRVTDFLILLAREEEGMEADFYWMAEPVASLFSPAACRTFCTRYIKEIFDAVTIPGILHVCGKTDRHTQALLDTGAQGLSIDWCTDFSACLALAPDDVVIMGNISPILLWKGSQEEVRAQTELLLEQTKNYKNVVIASGCQVPDIAPKENVQLMVDLAKGFSLWSNDEYRMIRRLSAVYCRDGQSAFEAACTAESISGNLKLAAEDVSVRRLAALQGKK